MKTARNRKGCIDNPNLAYQAEPIIVTGKIINGEANNMEDGVFPTIYTEKKDGVQPEFDIRTDRFEVAIDAIDKINTSAENQIAKNKGETEEVNEIQFLTNNPYTPTIESNGITKLGDNFVFERTYPDAPGLKEPENPRKATNIVS